MALKKITRENTVLLFLTAIVENLSFLDILYQLLYCLSCCSLLEK